MNTADADSLSGAKANKESKPAARNPQLSQKMSVEKKIKPSQIPVRPTKTALPQGKLPEGWRTGLLSLLSAKIIPAPLNASRMANPYMTLSFRDLQILNTRQI